MCLLPKCSSAHLERRRYQRLQLQLQMLGEENEKEEQRQKQSEKVILRQVTAPDQRESRRRIEYVTKFLRSAFEGVLRS